MMKVALVLMFLVIGQSLAAQQSVSIKNVSKPEGAPNEYKLCNFCIQITGQTINQLLNIVLNAGVVGGCADVCGILKTKTNSEILGIACNILCDYVGIKEFISLIQKADLDPFYYCELAHMCLIKDDGDAKIVSLTVTPPSVEYGNNFEIDVQFQTANGTGTGEIALGIETVDGIPLGQNNIMLPLAPGAYAAKWSVTAAPDPNCDPTQGFCEMWLPGNYTVIVDLCNGECGSSHPHSKLYSEARIVFSVVKN